MPRASSDATVKKRGRKPREKAYSLHTPEDTVRQEDQENIILHLPISSEEALKAIALEEHILDYDPESMLREPTPYAPDLNVGSYLEKREQAPKAYVNEYHDKKHDRIIRNLLVDLHGNELPMQTEVHCWWCCHGFTNQPCGIPVRYVDNVFHVQGVFCSFSCACAYLVNEAQNRDQMWSSYSLLHLLCRKALNQSSVSKIHMAPPRQALQKFGGFLSIDEFRQSFGQTDKQYKLLLPPMCLVVPQIEECTSREEDVPIPVNKHRMHVATEAIKLKRSKPILDSRLTLENFMKIQTIQPST